MTTTGHVLILEDDPSIRELLQEMLSLEGHVVEVCDSPSQLCRRAAECPHALAVADFWGESQLVLSDDERADVIKVADAVPTILVTGRTWAGRYTARDLGVLEIVLKPWDADSLSDLVGCWIATLKERSAEARRLVRDGRERLKTATDRLCDSCRDLARLSDTGR